MALIGKLSGCVEISADGHIFHELIRHKPHEVTSILPDKIHGCDLVEGQRGDVGSTVCWDFTLEGEKRTSKMIIEAVDEEKHMIVFKLIKMALSRTLVKQIAINSDGDAFLELFTHKPHKVSDTCPRSIQGAEILDGEWGVVGSIVAWRFHHGGKDCYHKDMLEEIDREKKLVCYKEVEGTQLEHYNSFKYIIQVDTTGPKHLVIWKFIYEKRNENVQDPNALMDFCLNFTKEIDDYQQKHCN
ncbi:hypothetical protein LXL04_011355 [Taraxacum kok-saghyz]